MSAFDATFSHPPEHNGPLPDEADVVVIGGGVVGTMAAWHLNRAGQRVVLIEKGRIGCEQSSRNWGWIRQQGRDLAELPIMIEAMSIWQTLAQQIGPELGFQQHGIVYAAQDQKELGGYETWLAEAKKHGVDTRMLTARELSDLFPAAQTRYAGGMITPSDAKGEPWRTVPAVARFAAAEGVTIVEQCAARMLTLSADKVSGVETERGHIKTARVILAGGAWSSLFLRNHGVKIPQLSVRATVAATAPVTLESGAGALSEKRLSFRKRDDGGLTIAPSFFHELFIGPDAFRNLRNYIPTIINDGANSRYRPVAPKGFPDAWGTPRRWSGDEVSPFERMRVLNPAPNEARIAQMHKRLGEMFPDLAGVPLIAKWAGMIDVMPDVVPIVDHVPELPGLILGTGMSGHGFGIGPGMGRVLADLAMGKTPGHDLSAFSIGRFAPGAKTKPPKRVGGV